MLHTSRSKVLLLTSVLIISIIALYGFSSHRLFIIPMYAQNGTSPMNGEDHFLHAAVYSTREDKTSTLVLNNASRETLTARVTLYNQHGRSLTIPDITLAQHENRFFNVADWLTAANAEDDFAQGSLEVFFHGRAMGLGAQLVVEDKEHSLSFDVPLTEDMDFASSQLDSLYWLPDAETRAYIFLANTRARETTVTPTFYVNGAALEAEPIVLKAHASDTIDVKRALDKLNANSDAPTGGVRLKYTNESGAVAIAGAVINKHGFSSTMRFVDLTTQQTTTLHGAYLPIGTPDAAFGFTGGTLFMPHITVRNTTDAPVEVKAKVRYQSDGEAGSINAAPITLPPYAVSEIDLSRVIARLGHKASLETGIEIQHNGQAGAIIAIAASVDQSGSQVIDVPVKDPQADIFTGGSYPLDISNDKQAIVHLKNIDAPTSDDRLRQAVVIFYYDGGNYTLPLQLIKSGQTFAVNIRKLRDEQIKDGFGKTIPPHITHGQLVWYNKTKHGSFIGRLVSNRANARVSSSFSCPNCYCNLTYVGQEKVSPSSFTGKPGDTFTLSSSEVDKDCSGLFITVPMTNATSFSSTDSSVVSVSGTTATIGNTAGTARIEGYWNTNDGIPTECPPRQPTCRPRCDFGDLLLLASANVTNVQVKILRDSTDITNTTQNVIVGQQINLTASVLPSGVSASSPQWTIPGNRIANYVANNSTGTVTQLTAADLQKTTVNFYWVDGADSRQVQYSASVNGQTFTGTATFNVKRPSATVTATTGTVTVSVVNNPPLGLGLHFGDPSATPGIRFSRTINNPSGFTGDTQWVQVVTSSTRTRTPNSGNQQTRQGYGLDTTYPYDTPATTDDSPFSGLTQDYSSVSVNDNLTMWLMFRPSSVTGTSIWIPLRKVDWNWRGGAVRIIANNWNLSDSSNSVNPSDADTIQHPVWTTNIRDFSFQ